MITIITDSPPYASGVFAFLVFFLKLLNQSALALIARLGATCLLFSLIACNLSNLGDDQASGTSKKTKRIQVVTTFLPITLFTQAVAGECASVTALIPPHLGPHDFQATPADVNALGTAKVLVKNGLGMEGFLDKLITSAANPKLTVIDSSLGVATIDSTINEDHSNHDHGHGEVNPHIWLDPLRAVQQVETIRDGLIKADPSCSEGYKRNAEIYTTKLKDLNEENADNLKKFEGKTFIAFHDFAPYFAERYGLKAKFLVDLPEMNPSPKDMQRISSEVRKTQLKALLSEPQEGNRSFNVLARDLGINIIEFDPIETGTSESAANPDNYLTIMRNNVINLIRAIGD